MVSCCFWLPDAGGPFEAVRLTALAPDEWDELAEWTRSRGRELPALAKLLSGPLPREVTPADVSGLSAECEHVDWDSLAGPALGGFASLSLVISLASQTRTGLRFAPEVVK
jgi:hypothetical protein